MSDRLFAGCCLGSPVQHALWEPCPLAGLSEAEAVAVIESASDSEGRRQAETPLQAAQGEARPNGATKSQSPKSPLLDYPSLTVIGVLVMMAVLV